MNADAYTGDFTGLIKGGSLSPLLKVPKKPLLLGKFPEPNQLTGG